MTNNKSDNIIPVFSGERQHGEVIEGYIWANSSVKAEYIQLKDEPQTSHWIDKNTLKMSLDNGETWRSMGEIREALEFKKAYDKKCLIDPTTWHQGFDVSYECPHCGALVYDKKRIVECDQCHKKLDWSNV